MLRFFAGWNKGAPSSEQQSPSPPLASGKHLLPRPQHVFLPQRCSVGAQHVPDGRQWPCGRACVSRLERGSFSAPLSCND